MWFDCGDVERFVQFLQIIDQQVGPRPVDRMSVANQTFLKIETTLAPSKDFGNGRLALQAPIDGVSNGAVTKVNLTLAATGFESEPSGALAKVSHLQNLGSGKVVKVGNKRMARNSYLQRLGAT